jgi:hypothetical protein
MAALQIPKVKLIGQIYLHSAAAIFVIWQNKPEKV